MNTIGLGLVTGGSGSCDAIKHVLQESSAVCVRTLQCRSLLPCDAPSAPVASKHQGVLEVMIATDALHAQHDSREENSMSTHRYHCFFATPGYGSAMYCNQQLPDLPSCRLQTLLADRSEPMMLLLNVYISHCNTISV
jgi:hypothetical protein